MGRFSIAAKHVLSLAELFETSNVDLEKAICYYQQAADHYEGEDQTSGQSKCLIKVATLSAQLGRYEQVIAV